MSGDLPAVEDAKRRHTRAVPWLATNCEGTWNPKPSQRVWQGLRLIGRADVVVNIANACAKDSDLASERHKSHTSTRALTINIGDLSQGSEG